MKGGGGGGVKNDSPPRPSPSPSNRPSYREQIRLMIEVDGHFQRARVRPETRRHRYRAAVTNAQQRSTASASFGNRTKTRSNGETDGWCKRALARRRRPDDRYTHGNYVRQITTGSRRTGRGGVTATTASRVCNRAAVVGRLRIAKNETKKKTERAADAKTTRVRSGSGIDYF